MVMAEVANQRRATSEEVQKALITTEARDERVNLLTEQLNQRGHEILSLRSALGVKEEELRAAAAALPALLASLATGGRFFLYVDPVDYERAPGARSLPQCRASAYCRASRAQSVPQRRARGRRAPHDQSPTAQRSAMVCSAAERRCRRRTTSRTS